MKSIMIIIFFISLILFVIGLYIGRNKYKELFEPLDTKEFNLKKLLPFGMVACNLFKKEFETKYDINLYQKITLIYGTKYGQYYLRVYWSMKFLYSTLSLLVMSFIGLLSDTSKEYIFFLFFAVFVTFFLSDTIIEQKAKERMLNIKLEFPEFISVLSILLDAGLSVNKAIEKISADKGCDTPLYSELSIAVNEIKTGRTDLQVFDDLSDRCKLREMTALTGMLKQNARLGGSKLSQELKKFSNETWQLRKNTARQLGETASSKLMLPLTLMFIAILLIVMTPTLLALTEGLN